MSDAVLILVMQGNLHWNGLGVQDSLGTLFAHTHLEALLT